MYRIGELDKRIGIERDMPADDGMGGQDKVPHIILNVWAKVRKKSVRESLVAQHLENSESTIFVIRWRNDLKPSDRIVFRGVRYKIVGPMDLDNRKPFMEIEAVRGVA